MEDKPLNPDVIECPECKRVDNETEKTQKASGQLDRRIRPTVLLSDDYAVLSTENHEFYYGYEETENLEWCFTTTINEEKIKVPFSKLKVKDEFACAENLLIGIGWVLTKYKLIQP